MQTKWIVVVGLIIGLPLVIVVLAIVVFVGGVSPSFRSGHGARDGKVAACASFEGGDLDATWTQCPDKVRREVRCEHFVRDLTCHCYEDGVDKWFFNAKDPPLSTRAEATRVANANCHWSLERP